MSLTVWCWGRWCDDRLFLVLAAAWSRTTTLTVAVASAIPVRPILYITSMIWYYRALSCPVTYHFLLLCWADGAIWCQAVPSKLHVGSCQYIRGVATWMLLLGRGLSGQTCRLRCLLPQALSHLALKVQSHSNRQKWSSSRCDWSCEGSSRMS